MPDQSLYTFLKERGLSPSPPSHEPLSEAPQLPSSDATGDASGLRFDDDGIGENLRRMEPEQLDAADFGIVKVDDQGRVLFYNRYESELAGVSPEAAHGKNFFTQLAPCSNNRIFLGRFKRGVQSGDLDAAFTYTFTYKMRPTLVDVRLYRDDAGNNWVMVRKR